MNKTMAHPPGPAVGFCQEVPCSRSRLENTYLHSPQNAAHEPLKSLGLFYLLRRISVPPSLLPGLFLSLMKQWLCWSHEARLETHSGEIPLPLQSLLPPPLSLFPWNLSLQPCDRSPRALLFVLAEVRIWRAMLHMD